MEDCGSFGEGNFPNLRMPPLLTKFDTRIFERFSSYTKECKNIVSIEISENISQVIFPDSIHRRLPELRNIAFPVGCSVHICGDNMEDTEKSILYSLVHNLQHRFDVLPLHKICYYHSYHDTGNILSVTKRIIYPWSTKTRCGKLCDIGKRQDFQGMTPLHILACSTKHHLEMYQMLVEKYPETLVTEDCWGDTPFYYALLCNVPNEIIAFLAKSYKLKYPENALDWEDVLYRFIEIRAPLSRIQILLETMERYFPDDDCNLDHVVMRVAYDIDDETLDYINMETIRLESYRFLVRASIAKRLDMLNVTQWQDELRRMQKMLPNFHGPVQDQIMVLYDKLDEFENKKEATSLLELAMWKAAMMERSRKRKAKIGSGFGDRQLFRIKCGAEIVIRNVVPFLWCASLPRNESDFDESFFFYDGDY